MNRSSIGRSGCQYHEYCVEHCMGLVVTLQHKGKLDLCGCMIMQSTTWPWRVEVYCCLQSNALRSKRTWRVGGSCLRLAPELRVTVCDAVVGFKCDWCSSRMLLSSTENQNLFIYPVGGKYPSIVPRYPLFVNLYPLFVCHPPTRDISFIPC